MMGGTEITGATALSTMLGVDPPGTAELAYSWDFGDGQQGTGPTPSHVYDVAGTYTVMLTVSTEDGRSGSSTALVTVAVPPNAPPVAAAGGSYTGDEGGIIGFSGAVSSDPDGDALTYAWDFGDGATGSGVAPSHTYADNATYTVGLTVTDTHGLASTPVSTTAIIANVAPTITSLTLLTDPVPVGSTVALAGAFTDPSTLDTHTATVDWDDDAGAVGAAVNQADRTVSASRTFTTAGVYTVSVTVTDDDGASVSRVATSYLVVFDPSAGFVTGGGWITSPAGAYATNPALTGKASFGFVARYEKGATTPTGNTEFQFHAASFEFSSSDYQWLVVAGARAQFKGAGTVNGGGNYGFMLSAVDGQETGGGGVDKFRIKIWDVATGDVVYDNQMGSADDAEATTALGGGSIVIHK
jgi:PKD repeat protein